MDVRSTMSHDDSPCSKYCTPMLTQEKLWVGNECAQTDRQTEE